MKPPFIILCLFVIVTAAAAAGRHVKSALPLSIAQGAEVELSDFVVTGKTTVFVFTSEYCAPCRAYDDALLRLHRQGSDLAVVKVDINRPEIHRIDWDSPVARQYQVHGLPYFRIVSPDGKLAADGPAARDEVDGWIRRLK